MTRVGMAANVEETIHGTNRGHALNRLYLEPDRDHSTDDLKGRR